MTSDDPPEPLSSLWHTASSIVLGLTGAVSRSFLIAANRLECNGLEGFLELLEQRHNVEQRQRGLITVANHLSILDDPLVWGALPYKYHWTPSSVRWGLGSHDLMFKNSNLCTFWSLGQVLPTHRLAHSPYGGAFQSTMTQAVRLLSARPDEPEREGTTTPVIFSIPDPFTDPTSSTYHSSPEDTYAYPSPSYHPSQRYAWVHVFPEGRIHQHPDLLMRYFKWGVARLILEAEPAPTLVPIWIEGFQNVMPEARQFPRFVPRAGKRVSVTFGQGVETDQGAFGDLRARWRRHVTNERERLVRASEAHDLRYTRTGIEDMLAENLKYGEDAVRIREECTFRVREEMLQVRRSRGFPDEDPKARLVDTWFEEGRNTTKREGRMNDGSWVRDT